MSKTAAGTIGQSASAPVPGRLGLLGFCATVLVFLAVGRFTDFVPFLRGLPLVKVVAALAVLALLFERVPGMSAQGWKTPIARNSLLLLLMTVVSVLFSIWKSKSLEFVLDADPVLVLIFLVVSRVATSWLGLKRVLAALAFCGVVLAVVAVASYGGGRAAVQAWYDTNDLAYVLDTLLPVAFALSHVYGGRARLFWLAACGLFVVVIVLTGSRGGVIGLVLLLIGFLFLGTGEGPRRHIGKTLFKSALWGVVACAIVAISWPYLPAVTQERLQSLTNLGSDYNMEAGNTDSRVDIWKRGLTQLAGRPIGFGVGTYMAVDGRTGGVYHTAHNSVVLVLVELGVIGGLLFLRQYRLAWRSLKDKLAALHAGLAADGTRTPAIAGQAAIAGCLRMTLIGNFAAGFFLSQSYSFLLWSIFAAISGFCVLPSGAELPVSGSRSAPAQRSS